MKVNKYLREFLTNFLFGGIVIGLYSLLIKFVAVGLAGHASGALPLVFTYVIIKTHTLFGYEEAKRVSKIGFIGGFFWLSYAFIVYLMLQHNQNIVFTLCTAFILFIITNCVYYKLINK
jgi:hypothetical protein